MNTKSLSNFIAFILNKSNNNHNSYQTKKTKQKMTRFKRINRGYYTVALRYECYFRVAKQYFTNGRSESVKYCFCHEKITFISSSRRVMFFLLYRRKEMDKIIEGNYRNYVIDKPTCEIMEKKSTWVPDVVFMNFTSGIFSSKTHVSIY